MDFNRSNRPTGATGLFLEIKKELDFDETSADVERVWRDGVIPVIISELEWRFL